MQHPTRIRSYRLHKPSGQSIVVIRGSVASYRRAIRRASVKGAVPIWHPHQLRHTAATSIRRRFGLEAAQAVLGHSEIGTTQVYAERNLHTAREVMAEMD